MTQEVTIQDDAVLDRAIGRAKWHFVPFFILLYTLAHLDRSNVGFARQAYQTATGISDAAFAFGAGAFFLTYAISEIPSNLVMHRVGAKLWMARIMISWGFVAAAMVFATTDTSFGVVRMLLGIAEGGFFPGVILYFTYWFPAKARGQIIGLFFFGSPFALMVGGPIAGLIFQMDGIGGLAGWQWLYLVEGLGTSAVGVWTYFFLTDKPAQALWMPADERDALTRAVAAEENQKKIVGRTEFLAALKDRRLWHFVAILFFITCNTYAVAFYLPSVVSTLFHVKVGILVGFVTAIPYACAIAAAGFWPHLAVKTDKRRLFAVISLGCTAVGLVTAMNVPPVLAIIAFCFVTAGITSSQPIFWTFPAEYLGGTAAAGGIALINAVGNLGGFFGPNIKNLFEQSFHSSSAGLYAIAVGACCAALLIALLRKPRGVSSLSRPVAEGGGPGLAIR